MKRFIKCIAAVLLLVAMLTGAFAACAEQEETTVPPEQEQGGESGGETSAEVWEQWEDAPYEVQGAVLSEVGYRAEYLGNVSRTKPQVSNGGLPQYPSYGITLSLSTEERQAVIAENNRLNASASTYTSMDANGNLYLNGRATGEKLYKHSASVGLYEGDVSDEEQAVIKQITITPRSRGNHITGLYAPAGEVITLEMSDEDLAKTGGIKVTVGQVFSNGTANNIWAARELNRMPNLANTMTISENIGYFGSFLGGPIYIEPVNKEERFTVTISGAVNYSHYIYGYTTREEFERNADSSAPYFDLEVWYDGVRHSGSASRAEQFDYGQLTDAAELWQKIALVSNKVPAGNPSEDTGITFLYDPFVAAGSMVAFVGHYGTNCPLQAMAAALDAHTATTNPSGNFWGVLHEYNHNYQNFGMEYTDYGGATNEVTNNVVNIAEYTLFTSASSLRTAAGANGGNYADGWSRYTNPEWTLRQTLAAAGSRNAALDTYVNLIHSFGQDIVIKSTNVTARNSDEAWFASVSENTGYDMSYYMRELLQANISEEMAEEYAGGDMYVPVASVYQTGASYFMDGVRYYSKTAQPYVIQEGETYTMDFNENLVVPEGFSWRIKSFTNPSSGSIQRTAENVYTYTPGEEKYSGKMYLTLQITKDDGAFDVRDTELVIELCQGQLKKDMLTRTVYTYSADKMYADAQQAYEADFSGYTSVYTEDNVNRVQNGNFEIWEPQPADNAVMVVEGKYIVPSDGKYRFALRGRQNAAMYISVGGGGYSLCGVQKNGSGADYYLNDANTYSDFTLTAGEQVYIKAVLLVKSGGAQAPYIGVGVGKFDESGGVNISHMSAVRTSYNPEEEDISFPYLYKPQYTYRHDEVFDVSQTLISFKYSAWDESYAIGNLFDEDDTNFIHSDRTSISEENPFEIVVSLGQSVRANAFTIYGESSRQYQPKDFKLYGGSSESDLTLLADVKDAPRSGINVTVMFPEREISCYKLVVTDTYAENQSSKYIAFRYTAFSFSLGEGEWISPADEMFTYRGEWSEVPGASFGKLMRADNGSVTFTTDKTFAVIGGGEWQVYIDGVKTDGNTSDAFIYISPDSDGEREVTIGSDKGAYIDSIVLFG